jgi:hypothetical protein
MLMRCDARSDGKKAQRHTLSSAEKEETTQNPIIYVPNRQDDKSSRGKSKKNSLIWLMWFYDTIWRMSTCVFADIAIIFL